MRSISSKITSFDIRESNPAKAFFAFFCVYALFMIPIAVAFYPVLAPVDFFLQVEDFLSGTHHVDVSGLGASGLDIETMEGLSAHHPIAVTLLYGTLTWIGQTAAGNVEIGLFLCQMFNLIAAAACFSFITCKLFALFDNKAVIIAVAVVLICPFAMIQVMHCGKDSLFAMSFAWMSVLLIETAMCKGDPLGSARFSVTLVLAGTLCILTRQTGVFIVVPTFAVLALAYRDKAKRAIGIGVSCILVGVLPVSLAIACGAISKDDTFMEACGNLFQQTAAYSLAHADEQSADEIEAIDKILDYDKFARYYDDDLADGIKFGTFRRDADLSASDKLAYLRVYAEEGLRHPETYAKALLGLMKPYIVPVYATGYEHLFFFVDNDIREYLENDRGIVLSESEFPDGAVVEDFQSPEIIEWMFDNGKTPAVRMNSSYFTALENYMDTNTDTPLKRFYQLLPYRIFAIPVIGLLFSRASFALFAPIAMMVCAAVQRRKSIVYIAPIALLMASLLFCPYAPERYIAPLVVVDQFMFVPLLVEAVKTTRAGKAGKDANV